MPLHTSGLGIWFSKWFFLSFCQRRCTNGKLPHCFPCQWVLFLSLLFMSGAAFSVPRLCMGCLLPPAPVAYGPRNQFSRGHEMHRPESHVKPKCPWVPLASSPLPTSRNSFHLPFFPYAGDYLFFLSSSAMQFHQNFVVLFFIQHFYVFEIKGGWSNLVCQRTESLLKWLKSLPVL